MLNIFIISNLGNEDDLSFIHKQSIGYAEAKKRARKSMLLHLNCFVSIFVFSLKFLPLMLFRLILHWLMLRCRRNSVDWGRSHINHIAKRKR